MPPLVLDRRMDLSADVIHVRDRGLTSRFEMGSDILPIQLLILASGNIQRVT